MPGVIRTRVGYTGGTSRNPTYHNLGGHTESLQVDFDPQRISYQQLLDVYFANHDPYAPVYSVQYKAAIYFADAEQERLARASAAALEQTAGRPVRTEILPLEQFYRAEDYHQKYYVQHQPQLWPELKALYGQDWRALTDSTLAARLNAYAGHFGNPAVVTAELDSYGLSAAAREYLQSLAPSLSDESLGGACALPQ